MTLGEWAVDMALGGPYAENILVGGGVGRTHGVWGIWAPNLLMQDPLGIWGKFALNAFMAWRGRRGIPFW